MNYSEEENKLRDGRPVYQLKEWDLADGKTYFIDLHLINKESKEYPEVMCFESEPRHGRIVKVQIVNETATGNVVPLKPVK